MLQFFIGDANNPASNSKFTMKEFVFGMGALYTLKDTLNNNNKNCLINNCEL